MNRKPISKILDGALWMIVVALLWIIAVAAHGQTNMIPQVSVLHPMVKAIQTPKMTSLRTAIINTNAASGRGYMKNGPVKVFAVEWKPGLDGANVATIIETTLDDLQNGNPHWVVVYAGKGTGFNFTNGFEFGHYRSFRGSTTLTNL